MGESEAVVLGAFPGVAVAFNVARGLERRGDGTAQSNVEFLNAAANGEQRNAPFNGAADQRQSGGIAGRIDVAQVLEPYASAAVAAGQAHIWHRFANRGDIGYTSFYTTRSYLDRNRETCTALLAGITPALAAMASDPASGIAAELAPLFPEVPPPVLTGAIAGYQASGLWAKQTDLPPAAFVRLKGALLSGGLISRDIPYDHVIARLQTS